MQDACVLRSSHVALALSCVHVDNKHDRHWVAGSPRRRRVVSVDSQCVVCGCLNAYKPGCNVHIHTGATSHTDPGGCPWQLQLCVGCAGVSSLWSSESVWYMYLLLCCLLLVAFVWGAGPLHCNSHLCFCNLEYAIVGLCACVLSRRVSI